MYMTKLDDIKRVFLNPMYVFMTLLGLDFPDENYPYCSIIYDTLDQMLDFVLIYGRDKEKIENIINKYHVTDDMLLGIYDGNNPLREYMRLITPMMDDIILLQQNLAYNIREGESADMYRRGWKRLFERIHLNPSRMYTDITSNNLLYGDNVIKQFCLWFCSSVQGTIESTMRSNIEGNNNGMKERTVNDILSSYGESDMSIFGENKSEITISQTKEKREREELIKNVNLIDKQAGCKLKKPKETIEDDFGFNKAIEKYRIKIASKLFDINEASKLKKEFIVKDSVFGKIVRNIKINKKFKNVSKWFSDDEVDPTSREFLMRLITHIMAWVVRNLSDICEICYVLNEDGKFIEYESKLDYAENTYNKTINTVRKIMNGEDISDDLIYFEELMTLLESRDEKTLKKYYKKIRQFSRQTSLLAIRTDRWSVASEDITMDTLVKLAYMVTTNDPGIKGRLKYHEEYRFRDKKQTHQILEELGEAILESRDKYTVPKLFKMYIKSDPKLYSRWEDVNDNENLGVGSIAIQYLGYLMNDKNVHRRIRKLA